MNIQVLYIADCPNHTPTLQRLQNVLRSARLHNTVTEIPINTAADAETWRFLGSPTVRINGLDIEPEARTAQHFGLGCRSYAEDGHRSGLPSEALILQAIHETPHISQLTHAKPVKSPESSALAIGGVAAILASSCCLGPLLLVTLGFSGAWIGNLTALEPYRPWFIAAALIALFFAGRRIFRKSNACTPGELCALPKPRRTYKAIFGIVTALVAVALVFPYVARFFY